jgi:hypothetical protein
VEPARATRATASSPPNCHPPTANRRPPTANRQECVEIINSAFPEEIVRYYSPSYSKQLLDKLDAAAATATTMQAVA